MFAEHQWAWVWIFSPIYEYGFWVSGLSALLSLGPLRIWPEAPDHVSVCNCQWVLNRRSKCDLIPILKVTEVNSNFSAKLWVMVMNHMHRLLPKHASRYIHMNHNVYWHYAISHINMHITINHLEYPTVIVTVGTKVSKCDTEGFILRGTSVMSIF